MIKRYLLFAVIGILVSGVVGGGVYALKSHNLAVADAYTAGENDAELACATEKLAAVEQATRAQEQVYQADKDAVLAQLDQSRQLAQRFETRYRDSMRFANELHTKDSQCNYSVGVVRMLNDTVRDGAGLPAVAALSDAAARAPSVVTGDALTEWAGHCAAQYGQLSSRYNLLLSLVEDRAGQRAGSS